MPGLNEISNQKYFCPANLGEIYVICLHMTDHDAHNESPPAPF